MHGILNSTEIICLDFFFFLHSIQKEIRKQSSKQEVSVLSPRNKVAISRERLPPKWNFRCKSGLARHQNRKLETGWETKSKMLLVKQPGWFFNCTFTPFQQITCWKTVHEENKIQKILCFATF